MRNINVKRRINISLWSFICALLLFVTACSKEEKAEVTKADVTEYSLSVFITIEQPKLIRNIRV